MIHSCVRVCEAPSYIIARQTKISHLCVFLFLFFVLINHARDDKSSRDAHSDAKKKSVRGERIFFVNSFRFLRSSPLSHGK